MSVDCSIIIVSWNVADLLERCLLSIQAAQQRAPHLRLETLVVDSASSDDTLARLTRFDWIQLFAQTENIGYTRGNNLALRHAQGRYLFLLNPDTELLDDALSQLIAYLDAHPDVGIIGTHTLNSDGTHQSTRRRFPSRRLAFFESTWLETLAPAHLLSEFRLAERPDDDTFEVDWVQGSALLARRAVYEQIGGLDEGYVMYFEELDWCKRAKDQAWRVVYLGSARIIHHGGASSEQASTRKHIHFQSSKLRYFAKVYGLPFAQVLRLFLLFGYAWQLVLEGLKGLLGHKRPLRQQRVKLYWQVLSSRLQFNHP